MAYRRCWRCAGYRWAGLATRPGKRSDTYFLREEKHSTRGPVVRPPDPFASEAGAHSGLTHKCMCSAPPPSVLSLS